MLRLSELRQAAAVLAHALDVAVSPAEGLDEVEGRRVSG
eukprot:CAMPEP_0185312154 /NCGR_PEP_ID=MMETSP1363-20130426/30562_1 /TAXON_ID=38817 /ORGANISM="Gephyrocapsa oceanica, Strain RCC1303" /LENGTH=38 /DNA_ID= /DNA_START= /DNA_END= /DNA_ORIENTATION=